MDIEGNDYERIRFLNFATTEPSYIDPTQYKTGESKENKWSSIYFYNKNKADELIFNFTIFDDDYKEKRDSLKKYLWGKVDLIDFSDLKDVFKSTPDEKLKKVVNAFNKYAGDYEINTPKKIAHFFGQIGAETSLTNLAEDSYSKSGMLSSSLTRTCRSSGNGYVLKYCDLFTNYETESTNTCPFPHCTTQITVAGTSINLEGGIRYATQAYMTEKALEAKNKYFNEKPNDKDFFDYVYACRLGNGTIDSKDGSRFKGRGYLQMTGHYNYNAFQKKWNELNGRTKPMNFIDRTDSSDANIEKIETDTEISMLSAMVFWEMKEINDKITDLSDDNIKKISKTVNGGLNGLEHRQKITKEIYEKIKVE